MKKKIFFALSFLLIFCTRTKFYANEIKVPILMYHFLSNNASRLGELTIRPEELQRDIAYLKNEGYTTIFMSELVDYVHNGTQLPDKPIVITFDDAQSCSHRYLRPIIMEEKIKVNISVIGKETDCYTEMGCPEGKYLPHLTWGQINELLDTGLVELSSHSYGLHTKNGAKKLSGENVDAYSNRISDDLIKMNSRVKEMTGQRVITFVFPFGYYSDESTEILKEIGFKSSLICDAEFAKVKMGDPDSLFNLGRIVRKHNDDIGRLLTKYNY